MKQHPQHLIFTPHPKKVEKAMNASECYAQVYHGLVEFSHRRIDATVQLTWLTPEKQFLEAQLCLKYESADWQRKC